MDDSTPVNPPSPRRIAALQVERKNFENKQSEIEQWLMKNFSHPDRMKAYDDRNFYMYKINQIDEKIANIERGIPENGYATAIEPHSFNQVNKRTKQ